MRTVWAAALAAMVVMVMACEGPVDTGGPGDLGQSEEALKSPSRPVKSPDGKQIGTLGSPNLRRRQLPNDFSHHGGPMMMGPTNIYFIWYGTWTGHPARPVVTDLATNLGGSAYFGIVGSYTNAGGVAPANALIYSGAFEDYYSHGPYLSDSDVEDVVTEAISGGQLPMDPDAVYVVLPSVDVALTSGHCSKYCAFHDNTELSSVPLKYAAIGHPGRCASRCARQAIGPSGVYVADAMASLLAAEIFNSVTDPLFTTWYDRFGFEGADKCAWTYGETWTATNGALANVTLGSRDYLLQQLWVDDGEGYCGLSR